MEKTRLPKGPNVARPRSSHTGKKPPETPKPASRQPYARLSRMSFSKSLLYAAAAAAVAVSLHAQDAPKTDKPESPKEFKALKYRNIGPAAGGPLSRPARVPGNPLLYYAATASGGVWMPTDGGTAAKSVLHD